MLYSTSHQLKQPKFDNSNQYATTSFVQSALGNFSGVTTINTTPTTLLPAQAGAAFLCVSPASSVTLPLASSVTQGASYKLHTLVNITLTTSGTDNIQSGTLTTTSLIIPSGTEVVAISTGSLWLVFGTGALKNSSDFSFSLGSVYRYRLPSGILVQGGITASVPAGGVVITYPLAFTTAVLSVEATALNDNSNVTNEGATVMGPTLANGSTPTLTQMGVTSESNSGAGALTRVYWEVTGY